MRTTLCLLVSVSLSQLAVAEVKVEKVRYGGWENCYLVSNGTIDLVATSDVGPRLIHFGFTGGENEFRTMPDELGKTGGDEWLLYGGHRLWHSPEHEMRTYWPDNGPVELTALEDGIKLVQPVEGSTGIQKEIEVHMDAGPRPAPSTRGEGERAAAFDGASVRVVHRLYNRNLWDVKLAPWALSMMNLGGTAIVPQSLDAPPPALLPNRALVLWPYTRMTDPRYHWGDRYITLRQDPEAKDKTKFGLTNYEGWGAYYRKGHLFVKQIATFPEKDYADFGTTFEVYTDKDFLELETVGPLERIAPGAYAEHVERWTLLRGVKLGESEDDMDRALKPVLERLR